MRDSLSRPSAPGKKRRKKKEPAWKRAEEKPQRRKNGRSRGLRKNPPPERLPAGKKRTAARKSSSEKLRNKRRDLFFPPRIKAPQQKNLLKKKYRVPDLAYTRISSIHIRHLMPFTYTVASVGVLWVLWACTHSLNFYLLRRGRRGARRKEFSSHVPPVGR